MTLGFFLLARIAEDQARAERLDEHYAPFEREWEWCPRARAEPLGDLPGGPDAECECNCPAIKRRALAECEAKRQIVTLHTGWHECVGYRYGQPGTVLVAAGYRYENDPTLLLLALPYADRPGYDESWRTETVSAEREDGNDSR